MNRITNFGVAALVFALDRITKVIIERTVSAAETVVVIPNFFNIVYTRNRGAAFGFLADSDNELRAAFLIGVSAIVLAVLLVGLWQPSRIGLSAKRSLQLALALIVGGALGNLYDRLTVGSVTDFLQFFFGAYEFPSFNIADSAITVGCTLIIFDALFGRRMARGK